MANDNFRPVNAIVWNILPETLLRVELLLVEETESIAIGKSIYDQNFLGGGASHIKH